MCIWNDVIFSVWKKNTCLNGRVFVVGPHLRNFTIFWKDESKGRNYQQHGGALTARSNTFAKNDRFQIRTKNLKEINVLRFEFFESWKNRLRYIIYRFLSSSNIFILLKPWTCMKRCSCSSRSSLDPQKRYPWLFVWPGGGGAARGRSWDSINVSLSGGAVNGKPWA